MDNERREKRGKQESEEHVNGRGRGVQERYGEDGSATEAKQRYEARRN